MSSELVKTARGHLRSGPRRSRRACLCPGQPRGWLSRTSGDCLADPGPAVASERSIGTRLPLPCPVQIAPSRSRASESPVALRPAQAEARLLCCSGVGGRFRNDLGRSETCRRRSCGVVVDRDVNAAMNLLADGRSPPERERGQLGRASHQNRMRTRPDRALSYISPISRVERSSARNSGMRRDASG